jgi:hypothetical protein
MPFKRRVEPWPEDDGHEFIHPDHFHSPRNTVQIMPDNRWRSHNTLGLNYFDECPWCGSLVPNWVAKRLHITFHDYLQAMEQEVKKQHERLEALEVYGRRVEALERWVNMPVGAEPPKELEKEDNV